MPLVLADRVRETTTTTGTGTISLAGPVSGFQGFSTAIGNANTTYYTIVDAATGAWEVGLGTYTSSGSTLSRTTVFSSSNSDALVPFAAGTKDVFVTQPAERAVYVLGAGTGLAAGAAAFTSNGVVYANSTSGLTTGSALTFDGTNFSIGGGSTSSRFNVTNGTSGGFEVNPDGTASGPTLIAYNRTSAAYLQMTYAALNHVFQNSGSEQMRLTSTGLGIGTSSPANKLVVSNAGAAGFEFDPAIGIMQTYNRSSGAYTAAKVYALNFEVRTGSSPAAGTLFIDSSGNLGIGTSSPGAKLEVNGSFITTADASGLTTLGRFSSGYAWSLIRPSSTATGIEFRTNAGDALYQLDQSSGANKHIWYTGATEQMRLTSTGLGIGTSSPAYKLVVNGAGSDERVYIQNTNTAGSQYFVVQAATGRSITTFVPGSATSFGNQYANPLIESQTVLGLSGATDIRYWVNNAEQMRLTSTGLGIGTSSPAYKLVVSNAGAAGFEVDPAGVNGGPLLQAYSRSGAAYVQLTYEGLQHIWRTSGTERARITSGGYFKASNSGAYLSSTGDYHELRSSNDNYLLYAVNTRNGGNGPFGISVEYSAQDPNGTGNEFLQCVGISTLRAEIRSNGGLANFSANDVNLSDRREKTNFAPAKSYLDAICAIPVQTFNYIDQSEDDPGLTLGVVAQDVQAVAPELVMESNWGSKDDPKMRLSIYQTDLQYALMKCIQELKADLDATKADVAALKGA